jgi:cysteinyl-tRNA synthetase
MSGRKMAKRVGNIARPADLYAAGMPPRALRYALISAHYRASLDFTDESLAAAAAAVERLSTLLAALDAYAEAKPDDATLDALLAETQARFTAALDDDLNVAPALAAIFDLARELNRRMDARAISTADADRAAAFVRDLDRVLAVAEEDVAELEPDLLERLEARATARATRDWAASDRLRDELAERGIAVEDTRDGQRWRRLTVVDDVRR